MRILALLLIGALAQRAGAQHQLLADYDWDPSPSVPDSLRKSSDQDVLMKRNILCHYDDSGKDLAYYQLFHMQRYLHDQASVDASKTIELGTGNVQKVISLKARSITPEGQVSELAESAFKRGTDERDGSSKVYFAFEGLRPGCIVEYIMLTLQSGDIQGDLTNLQFGVPAIEQRYELIVPRTWRFSFKGYNGVPLPDADSSHAGVVRHHLRIMNTPAIEQERTAMVGPYRKYIVARIDAIPERGLRDLSGFSGAARNIHSNLYPTLEKGTRKALAAQIKKMSLAFARDEEDRVRTLCLHVRSNFRLADEGGSALGDLDEILRTGNCNRIGLRRLFANLLREAGIEHQVVATCDRTEAPFDPSFEAHNYLRDYAFYFPTIDMYYDPALLGLGLGYIGSDNMGTHGLFVKNVEVNGVSSAISSIKRIPELPAERTRHDMAIDLKLNDDATESTLTIENGLSGYYASFIQNFWTYLDEARQQEMLEAHVKHFSEGATEQRFEVENGDPKSFGNKPFLIRGTVKTPMFTARAGDDVLLNVGELIGPQMEMYQEKARVLPVDGDFNRWYDRRIKVTVPMGWDVSGLEALGIHKTLTLDGQVQAEFKSSATLTEGVVSIEVVEYYKAIHVPVSHYEEYRAVINAAADFNKRVLVLRQVKK